MNQIVNLKTLKTTCQACSLSELCLPRSLDDGEMVKLDDIVQRKRPIKKGEYLFQVGQPFRSLFAVRSGSVKVFLPTPSGEEQIVGFHMPGELLGLDAMEHETHSCSAVALETTTVCELPYQNMQDLCHEIPGLNHQFMSLVSKEIGSEHEMLLMLGKKMADVRLAAFLLNLSCRFRTRGFSPNEFNLSMSRHDIANYLGLAVETVSRLFTRFQDDGMIEVHRRLVTIKDMSRLIALAEYAGINCQHIRDLESDSDHA
ncbi:MAG TPA: fumarate/nitrate reduction transcriptional regulator Fnr [Gammaproteobacteria bacterium]|nr:fumarate/nitrate reduction transcriptional regulator Fnr [Gammaproteobacteria bacterium]